MTRRSQYIQVTFWYLKWPCSTFKWPFDIRKWPFDIVSIYLCDTHLTRSDTHCSGIFLICACHISIYQTWPLGNCWKALIQINELLHGASIRSWHTTNLPGVKIKLSTGSNSIYDIMDPYGSWSTGSSNFLPRRFIQVTSTITRSQNEGDVFLPDAAMDWVATPPIRSIIWTVFEQGHRNHFLQTPSGMATRGAKDSFMSYGPMHPWILVATLCTMPSSGSSKWPDPLVWGHP